MNSYLLKRIIIALALLLTIASCSKSNEEAINDSLRKVKPELPLKINEYVTWVDAQAGQDELIYLYEMRGVDESKIDKESVIPKAKMSLITFLKGQKDAEVFFKRNISLRIVFRNEDGDHLFSFAVSRGDLGC